MELSGIVPLPVSVADNTASAFLPLDGTPALARIVRSMLGAIEDPDRIVIAAAEPLLGDVRAAVASQDLAAVRIAVVGGAGTRADCVRAALGTLRGAQFSTSHVLLHDVCSQLASADLMQRVVAAMRRGGRIVTPILAVTDSVKAVDVKGLVTATVDRSALRVAQYPRGFSIDALADLLGQPAPEAFDEMAAAIDAAAQITVVDGDPDACRIDLPRDAEFIEAIISSREPDLRDA